MTQSHDKKVHGGADLGRSHGGVLEERLAKTRETTD